MANSVIKAEAFTATTKVMTAAKKYAAELATTDDFMRPLVVAQALHELRGAIGPDVLAVVRSMENTPLGFRTDRQPGGKAMPYPDEVLRDCVIQGMLDGLGFSHNQWNIIGGNYYVTKNGWRKKLQDAGCSQIVAQVEAPLPSEISEQGGGERSSKFTAPMAAHASCTHKGQTYSVSMAATPERDTRRIVSAYGRDVGEAIGQMSGKAEATILRKLYYLCCDIPEVDEPEVIPEPIVIERTPESTPEQRDLYQRCLAELQAAKTLDALAETWASINELQKNGGITQAQLGTLTTAKDARKKLLS